MGYQIVGQAYPRLESVKKVLGEAKYTDDYILPDMAYCMVLRSPYAHAIVKNIDIEKAKEVPGVLSILLPQDVPAKLYNSGVITPSPIFVEDQRILTDHPLCMGDRIAAVAALTQDACREALEKIKVEYEVLEPVFDVDDALKEGAVPLHPQIRDSNLLFSRVLTEGDIEKGFAESDYIFEESFRVPTVQNVSMEPNSCICDYRPDGKLNIISTSQSPFKDRRLLSRLLKIRESDIRVVKPIMGGGFGERQQLHNQPIATIFSKELKRPIKSINSREEQMYGSTVRHSAKIHIKAGITKDGFIHALHYKIYINSGAYANVGGIVLAISLSFMNYNVPHYRAEGYCIYTNLTPGGAMRGFGNPQSVFAREIFLDKVARELQIDPVEFRLKNHLKGGDRVPGTKKQVSSCEIKKCLTEANKIKASIDQKETSETNPNIKEAWGVAFSCHPSGAGTIADAAGTTIMVNSDGTVELLAGSADIGQGSETVLTQIAAEALGLEMADVNIIAADTAVTAYETGTFASSQAFRAGNSVLIAARDVLAKAKKHVARLYKVKEEDVTFADRCFKIRLEDRIEHLSFKDAIVKINDTFGYEIITGVSEYKTMKDPLSFAVCWVKVKADVRTKSVSLKHVVQVVDIGQPINPCIVEGQIQGAISMAIGYAMTENIEVDKKTQKILSSDLLHYSLPLALDMPQIHVHIVESKEPLGPFGAKGVGELPLCPVAPAIINAIYNATGEYITEIPITHTYCPKGSDQ